MFEDTADNMTGIVVYLGAQTSSGGSSGALEAAAATEAAAVVSPTSPNSFFSV